MGVNASAQLIVKGTVLDSSRRYPIEAVTVHTTQGRLTMTDSLGRYIITADDKDSIWFSYLGKPTPRYPVSKIQDLSQFDISLLLKANVMREVRIRSRVYKEDSLQNRKDYAKVFNWKRPNLESLTSVTSTGAGFDLQEIIRVFQFRKNRSMERFRQRLLEEEHDKFIEHRFNKALVKRLTGLDDPELSTFMKIYRPTYAFTSYTSEYDFQLYIKRMGEKFKAAKGF
jgi:hypothetical protein